MSFRGWSLVVLLVLAAVSAPVASADPPVITPVPPSDPFTIVGACAFPVLVEDLVNNGVTKSFASGKEITTGNLVVRLTNTTNGKALVVNVSGPGFFRVNRDGSASFTLGGRGLLIGNAQMLDPLDPQTTLQSGRIVFSYDQAGEFVGAEFIGNSTDLCAALA